MTKDDIINDKKVLGLIAEILTICGSEKRAELSPREIQERETKRRKAMVSALATRVKNDCTVSGIFSVTMKLEFIKKNSGATLLFKELSHSETVAAFEMGIHRYRESVIKKQKDHERN